MTNLTLFGLSLAPLYSAIAEVESNRGATSANVYQIRPIYVDDVNQIIRQRFRAHASSLERHYHRPRTFGYNDVQNLNHAEYMMAVYWSHWGEHYEKSTGKPVTYEVLARIHNGGPLGWKKPETVKYWVKVLAAFPNQTHEDYR